VIPFQFRRHSPTVVGATILFCEIQSRYGKVPDDAAVTARKNRAYHEAGNHPLLVIGTVAISAGYCPAVERNAVVIGSRVQIHETAAGDSPTFGLLGEGVAVAILGRKPAPDRVEGFTDYWYRINYRGKTGWVFGQFIAPSTAAGGSPVSLPRMSWSTTPTMRLRTSSP
jgi:hypothetical protein